jgi:putative cell wall-binding protein
MRLAWCCILSGSVALAGAAPAHTHSPAQQAAAAPGADPHEGHDHRSESGPADSTRLVLTPEEQEDPAQLSEPGVIEGVVPDVADLPQEWLVPTPAGPAPAGDAVVSTQAVPTPPTTALPGVLDAAPGWQATYSCDPNDKPGMLAFAALVAEHYDRPRSFTSRRCLAGDNSQHYEGRALDWTMNAFDPDDKAIGDAVATWITANNGAIARRFGIMSVIWDRRSWYLYDPGSWRTYTGASPHTDHLHISFTWDGAMKRTSWWTGTPVTQVDHGPCRVYALQYAPRYTGRRTTPCPTSLPTAPATSYPVVLPGARSDVVATAQAHLGLTGLQVDGSFGPLTLERLLSHQRAQGLPVTGVLDNATWVDFTTGLSRVYGADRYATAGALSLFTPPGGDVYVTTGDTYPDALAASARAGSTGAPVLLVRGTGIPTDTVAALQRAKPQRIVVVGGAARIPDTVLDRLRTYAGAGGVTRVSGPDRYGTARELARLWGSSVPVAYVATGTDFPSALVGAARAARDDGPVLLTRSTSLPPATVEALQAVRPQRIVVVGNTSEVSSGVASALAGYATSGVVERVAGSSPAATAAALASSYPAGGGVAYVASSEAFPDALSAAARAGHQAGPVLLTGSTSLPQATRDALTRLRPRAVVLVGGPAAVSDGVLRELEAYTP